MAPVLIEVFFDYSSPWSFLCFSQLETLMSRYHSHEVDIHYKPTLVGAIFNEVNKSVYQSRVDLKSSEIKTKYYNEDLREWAEAYGLKIMGPYETDESKRVKPFPVNSVKALRGAFYFLGEIGSKDGMKKSGRELFLQYSYKVFRSYWSDCKDISQDAVLREIVEKMAKSNKNVNVDDFFACINKNETKEKLKVNVADCIKRGGFGVPTIFINKKYMYFGNDRLPLVERRIMIEIQQPGADIVGRISFQPLESGGKSRL